MFKISIYRYNLDINESETSVYVNTSTCYKMELHFEFFEDLSSTSTNGILYFYQKNLFCFMVLFQNILDGVGSLKSCIPKI